MSSTSAPPPRGAPAIDDDDADPIVASYSVFIKPTLPEHRNLVVLQYVTKTSQDPAQIRVPRITELRVKHSTGMYEVDVPMDTADAYDRNKGLAWGTSLQKSMEAKKDGSLGLAGGFNIVATPTTGRGRRGAAASTDDEPPHSWAEAARQDKVLRTQTFGGVRSAEEENTTHMIGVFQGKNLHLTPVSSVVHLRPVPHHLDASTEQERLSRGAAAGPPTGPEKAAAASAGRAIHMTIKSAMDGDSGGVATETMADRLRNVQTEAWQRMEWVHDEAELAWEAYNECLLLRPGAGAGAAAKEGEEGAAAAAAAAADGDGDGEAAEGEGDKGKGKEVAAAATAAAAAADGAPDESGAADLVDKVAHLKTDWGEQELLQAISGVMKHGEGAEGEGVEGKGKEPAVKIEEQPARAGARGAAAAAGSAAAGPSGTRKGTRRGANKSTAMEID